MNYLIITLTGSGKPISPFILGYQPLCSFANYNVIPPKALAWSIPLPILPRKEPEMLIEQLISSFKLRYDLASEREAAGAITLKLTYNISDPELDALIAAYRLALNVDRGTAKGMIVAAVTKRAEQLRRTAMILCYVADDVQADCYCCPGEETGRLFQDEI